MRIFNLTLQQMLMMFSLILVGFVFRRKRILPDNAGAMLAKLETYIFLPALSMYSMITKCTGETFVKNYSLIFCGFVITLGAILVSHPLSALFVPNSKSSPELSYKRNIYKYSMTFANYGFMGNFIILGIWGEDMFYKYTMFTFLVSVLCNSWGLYVLMPKGKSDNLITNIKKAFTTPPVLGLIIGMAVGVVGLSAFVPGFLIDALNNAGKCQGPVAMLLAGFVIGGYKLKNLMSDKKVYIASALRLVVIPAVIMLILKAFNATEELMTIVLIAFATPLGLNTIVFPAAFGGETETGASMAMISNVLSVITIPLMYLVFIVFL